MSEEADQQIRSDDDQSLIDAIDHAEGALLDRYADQMRVDHSLTRQLVSAQADLKSPVFRWFKFKEAFSSDLVARFIGEFGVKSGALLDPFSGSGTTAIKAAQLGMDCDAIELLPIGHLIGKMRLRQTTADNQTIIQRLRYWAQETPWRKTEDKVSLNVLNITKGAYPKNNRVAIERYLSAIQLEEPNARLPLSFALICILEDISYTFKTGRFPYWDIRAGRSKGKHKYRKDHIAAFDDAIRNKLKELIEDFSQEQNDDTVIGNIRFIHGSCLDVMQQLPDNFYEGIITSPPYLNGLDYTRTYALELAVLGVSEKGINDLRQQMLSCTTANRKKELLAINPEWTNAIQHCDELPLLQSLLEYFEARKADKKLNSDAIPRMIRGYFYEMACVIQECFRVLKPGASIAIVNDNVRYDGQNISVDLILSRLAEMIGFTIKDILVLPVEKGNSSQQMRDHGRDPLRKCVYVWEK